jgi:Secretion system C-terminal sorting domain
VQSDSLKVMVVGNFDVVSRTGNITFPSAGPWYSYLVNGIRNATGSAESLTLQPGEYYVYTNRDITGQSVTSVDDLRPDYSNLSLIIYPNPAGVSSVVSYEIPETGNVSISIWSMQGQRVGFYNVGTIPKGRYTIPLNYASFNISNASPGNYVMMIDVNGKRMKKQFVIGR